jgi:hypothetical protein
MKIQATVTVHDLVELDVRLPYFCKDAEGYFYAVYDEKNVLKIKRIDDFVSILKGSIRIFDSEVAKGVAITEEEFNQAYGSALQLLNRLEAA